MTLLATVRARGCRLLLAALLLGGCSAASWPPPSPAFTPRAECERHGGWWHSDLEYCEYQNTH